MMLFKGNKNTNFYFSYSFDDREILRARSNWLMCDIYEKCLDCNSFHWETLLSTDALCVSRDKNLVLRPAIWHWDWINIIPISTGVKIEITMLIVDKEGFNRDRHLRLTISPECCSYKTSQPSQNTIITTLKIYHIFQPMDRKLINLKNRS